MLIGLNIKNFALIQELSVEFGAGFNILSGETGAGKSILIDTIDYVLGGKFSKDLIRYGEEKTYVEAIFSIENINKNPISSYKISNLKIIDNLGREYKSFDVSFEDFPKDKPLKYKKIIFIRMLPIYKDVETISIIFDYLGSKYEFKNIDIY